MRNGASGCCAAGDTSRRYDVGVVRFHENLGHSFSAVSGQFSMDQNLLSRQNHPSDRSPSPEPPTLSAQSPAPPCSSS
ncbi:hypothetical protein Bca52824_025645 [Brassica carinata]|uniref:Uncharacterized protein n=1 Tax=Brassica carinata TaxID=52824 RepID=A0A8X7V8E2_BRACI|nr:hypothetical protein Bca52824_025645 [Brassica carinata]